MVLRRLLCLVFALVAIGIAGCGRADRPTQVAAGGGEVTTSTTAADPDGTTTAPTAPPASTTAVATTTATGSTSTTTAIGVDGSGSAPSPVDGLRADQLKAAVEAPLASSARALNGPTVDQVTLPDGTRVWRVRVPGAFAARSARVSITVGTRRVGEGVLAADLQSITAVTTDGTGLTAGTPVSFRWEGGPSTSAGTLAVVR